MFQNPPVLVCNNVPRQSLWELDMQLIRELTL